MDDSLLAFILGICASGLIRISFGTLVIWTYNEGFVWRWDRFDGK